MRFKINLIVEDKFVEENYAYTKEELEKDLSREINDMELGIVNFEIEEIKE
jgi:hypothetical protein